MSKRKNFKTSFGELSYKVNSLDDVFNLNDYPGPVYKLQEFFPKDERVSGYKKERKAKSLCKDIFTDFMANIARDMIYSNDMFVFPKRKFGFMKVKDMTNSFDRPFNFETEGKCYGPIIALDEEVNKKNKSYYKVKFNRDLYGKLMDCVRQGQKY